MGFASPSTYETDLQTLGQKPAYSPYLRPTEYWGRNLAGLWLINESGGNTVHDLSGNRNHGTIHGATWVAGKDGSALDFDGTDDYVDLHKGGEILSTDDLTACVWIRPDAIYREPILHKAKGSGSSSERSIYRLAIGSSNQPFFQVNNTVGAVFGVNGDAISTGIWYFIVITIANNVMRLYVDGQEKGTPATITGTRYGSDSGFDTKCYLGEQYPLGVGNWHDFDGLMDNVSIHNRALPHSQIIELFNYPRIMWERKTTPTWKAPAVVGVMAAHYYRRLLAGGR